MTTLDPALIARHFSQSPRGEPNETGRRLQRRAAFLVEDDRLLVELVFIHHVPLRRVAQAIGVSPGHLSRRAKLLHRRLHQPLLTLLCDLPDVAIPVDREIALDYFVRGRSMGAIGRRLGVPVSQVRSELQFIRGWLKAATTRR